ncbi:MAG: hypothetical protein IKQ80_03010 [Clostridia bacterium]|nr:hypothetical protein [Clostridia bacterium]
MGTITFDRENTRKYGLKFNIRTDADIIKQLEEQQSVQGYIKRLIRADIAAHGGTQEPTTDGQPGE